jgi:hypothetical protein
VSIVIVVDAFIFAAINVVVNVGNVVEFHGCPSSLHKCPHPFVNALQPLESWYHALF